MSNRSLLAALLLAALVPRDHSVTVWLAGDSTMVQKLAIDALRVLHLDLATQLRSCPAKP